MISETRPPASSASRLRDAALLGLLTCLFVYTYFLYLTKVGFPERVAESIPPDRIGQFLLFQLVRVLLVCLICAAVGVFLSRRDGLAGVGDLQSIGRSLPWVLGAAAIGVPAALLLFDRPFRAVAPGFYPEHLTWALAVAFSAAFAEEIIARFGLMTIFMGLFRRFHRANLAQAAFASLLAARSFHLAGQALGLNYLTFMGVGISLVGSLFLGWIYYRFGILAAILAHLLLELRILVFLFL